MDRLFVGWPIISMVQFDWSHLPSANQVMESVPFDSIGGWPGAIHMRIVMSYSPSSSFKRSWAGPGLHVAIQRAMPPSGSFETGCVNRLDLVSCMVRVPRARTD